MHPARAASVRRVAALAALALALLAGACRQTPGDDPAVVVTPRGDPGGPHRLRAAVLPVEDEPFLAFLAERGVAFRAAGSRYGQRLLYATLDAPAAEALADAFPAAREGLSPPTPFAGGDRIDLSTFAGAAPDGLSLHLILEGEGERVDAIDVAALVRPEDRSLHPVIRGRIPLTGAGVHLLAGEAAGRRLFVAVLALELAGAPPVALSAPPRRHRLRIEPFLLSSAALARALADLSLPEGGGTGGLAVHRLTGAGAEELASKLGAEGEAAPAVLRELEAGATAELPFGGHRLSLAPEYLPLAGRYRTGVRLADLPDAPGFSPEHDAGDPLLVLGWDASGPGRSRAALVRVEAD